jgi:hypothetical protein
MPNLGDYLGQIMAEITLARMQGDIAALKIAEQYAANDYLKYLSVPRFRIPNIEIDMPIVIKKVLVPQEDNPKEWNKFIAQIKNITDIKFNAVITERKINLEQEDIKYIRDVLNNECVELSKGSVFNLFSVANNLASVFSNTLRKIGVLKDPKELNVIEIDLTKKLKAEFIKLKVPQIRLEVLVSSSEIKEAGPDDVLTRLHLKINEEGFEWTTIEVDGIEKDRLVLE